MKILVASGSFKDVYTSIESCNLISSILSTAHSVSILPVCDGGEYTYDVLKSVYGDSAEEIYVENVLNPYGCLVTSRYLAIDGCAYVISSEILHLTPDEDRYKQPLLLSDYGLGQLISHAIHRGYKDIRLCLGGTSTIGCGFGAAQALGAEFYDSEGAEISSPISPESYCRIVSAKWNKTDFSSVSLSVVNDGITRACDLATVNPLKIGSAFSSQKEAILKKIDAAMSAVYGLTSCTAEDAWSGNGGGVYFGVKQLFENISFHKGADYFCNMFSLESAIDASDIVITGEGRFDNPHLKKIPVVVSEYAKKHSKDVVFACGQAAHEFLGNYTETSEGVYDTPELAEKYGITRVLSCTEYYASHSIDGTDPSLYSEYTPIILKQRFMQTGLI